MIWQATLVILLFLLLPVGAKSAEGRGDKTVLAAADLQRLLVTVAPMPYTGETNYARSNWTGLFVAANRLQKCSEESVELALKDFQSQMKPATAIEESKLLLLLRVAFDLPENAAQRDPLQPFGCWLTMGTHENPDGTVNIAWPIRWRGGNPTLVTGLLGYQGPPYDAAAEYSYFKRKYGFRKIPY